MSNVIDGINALKKRPRAGLLSVASLLPANSDWRRGIDYVPEGCVTPDAIPICGTVVKPDSEPQVSVSFKPFGVVAADGCNDPWMMNTEFRDRAQRTLDMGQSSILARELLQSTVTTNPDLQGTAVDLTALMPVPGPVGWVEAATALLYAMMNAGYVGDVVLHAPQWLLPSFMASDVGDIDPATRQAYIGPHPVVFDAGYNGLVGPGGAVGAAANIAGWVYATGPVEYAFGAPLDSDGLIAGDNDKNDRYVVAERPGILRFDPCQVFGVLVEVCQ
jgi:hypothetical protein